MDKKQIDIIDDIQNKDEGKSSLNLFSLVNDTNINETDDSYDIDKIKSIIESALFVAGNSGLGLNDLKKVTKISVKEIRKILKEWAKELQNDPSRGINIMSYGERYKFFSKSDNRDALANLVTIKYKNPLSARVMETLAIIAYNQPCTKSKVEEVREKDPTPAIQKLLELELIIEAGRDITPGKPFLYTVTHKFYDIFGIKNTSDLPSINIDQPLEDEDIDFFDSNRYED